MGKDSPTKRTAANDLIVPITKSNARKTSAGSIFRLVIVLCVLCFAAENSCAQTPSDQYLSLLAETIRSGTVEQKREALFQIRNIESIDASRIAVPALKDSNEIVRATAPFSVIFIPEFEAAKALVPLLLDKSVLVRREAAYALGKVGNPIVVNDLIRVAQKDKAPEARAAAVIALGEIGDIAAVGELTSILQRKQKSKEEFLRRSAARAIGQMAQIVQTDKVAVITPENLSPDKFHTVEQPKYSNLIATFPVFRAANDSLIKLLQNPSTFESVKREAAFALGEIADVASIPVLQANTGAADYYLAEIARESLRKVSIYAGGRKAPPSDQPNPTRH